jgi:hypothetical protein
MQLSVFSDFLYSLVILDEQPADPPFLLQMKGLRRKGDAMKTAAGTL